MKNKNILNGIIYRKFIRENKNFLCVVVGPTGSGKSWLCLRICEDWYKYYHKTEFPIENVRWNPQDVMERVVHGNLPEASLLILEEGGTSLNSLEFQNKIAKLFNYILQSFRNKRIGLLINLPNFSMLNKQTRMLMHMLLQINDIDRAKERVIFSAYHLQYNQQTGKLYRHKPRLLIDGVMEKIEQVSYSKPSEKIIKQYEQAKEEFVDGLSKDVLKDMKEYLQNRKPLTELQAKVLDCWQRGIFKVVEIGEIIGKRHQTVSQIVQAMRNKGYFKEDFNKISGEKTKKHKKSLKKA